MKKNLGRFIVFLLVCFGTLVQASTYEWDLDVAKKEAYVHEAVYFEYRCRFSDTSELYVIEFNPVAENENYRIKLLSESEKILDNKRENSFRFVLFVKKSGHFSLEPKALMKKTNKDSIENTVLGRDNRSYEEYSIKELVLPKIDLEIKASGEVLVGNFHLEQHTDQNKIKAYEPYHMELVISGKGNFDALAPFDFTLEGVKVFKEQPIEEIKLTKEGYEGKWSQKFAFVSDHGFTIAPQTLSYFNVVTKQREDLKSKAQEVVVEQNSFTPQELLDHSAHKSVVWKKEYLYYILTFFAGLLVGRVSLKTKRRGESKKDPFCKKLKDVKNLKQLSVLLILEDETKYAEVLRKIETQEIKSVQGALKLICA